MRNRNTDINFPIRNIKFCLEEFIDNEWNIVFIGTIDEIAEYCNCSYQNVYTYVNNLLYKPDMLKNWLVRKYMVDALEYVKEYERDILHTQYNKCIVMTTLPCWRGIMFLLNE